MARVGSTGSSGNFVHCYDILLVENSFKQPIIVTLGIKEWPVSHSVFQGGGVCAIRKFDCARADRRYRH
jgi:hypothetical protein